MLLFGSKTNRWRKQRRYLPLLLLLLIGIIGILADTPAWTARLQRLNTSLHVGIEGIQVVEHLNEGRMIWEARRVYEERRSICIDLGFDSCRPEPERPLLLRTLERIMSVPPPLSIPLTVSYSGMYMIWKMFGSGLAESSYDL